MRSLAELQRGVRDAVVAGNVASIAALLVGGENPVERVSLHRRQYHASLVNALLGRYPATAWLLGARAVHDTATEFVRLHPPTAPCIAEFGEGFGAFLAGHPVGQRVNYVASFAELEWHVGRVAVAVDAAPLAISALASLPLDELAHLTVTMQAGVHYTQAAWPVDELLRLFVTDSAPDAYALVPEHVRLELRGSRGDFHINRLDTGTYVFRAGIARGAPIAGAADAALNADPGFDPERALASVFADGLVTGCSSTFTPALR